MIQRQVDRVVFLSKDFTSGCTVEAHNFQRELAQYEQKNAVIVGVSVQDEDFTSKILHERRIELQAVGGHRPESFQPV